MKLTIKFLIAFLLVTLIPLSVATYGSVQKAEAELQSTINEGLETESKQIIAYFEHQYYDNWNHHIQLLVELIKQQPNLDLASLTAMVNVFLQENDGLVVSHLRLPNMAEPLRFFKQELLSNDTLKAQLVRENQITIGTSETQRISVDELFTLGDVLYVNTSYTFPWSENESAALGMTFKVEKIESFIHDEFIKGTSEYYILDGNGSIIFKSPSSIFAKDETISFSFLGDLNELINGENNVRKVEPFTHHSTDYVGFFTNFPRLKWGLVIVDKASSAYALVESMKQDIILWIILAIALCVVFSLFFTRSLTKSILQLTLVAKKIGQGELNQTITVKSKDEIGVLARTLEEMIKQLKERVNMMRFISQSTADMIADTDDVQGVVQRKIMTLFFSDIRGFTSFSESREPEEVIRMLNTFLSIQTKVIRDFGGEVDKFVGDEIFAVFFGEDSEQRGADAAVEIQKQLEIVRKTEQEQIHVGIGLHAGVTVMGTIGVGDRMDHTVLGSSVNLAARLCSHAKASEILLSESFHSVVKSKTACEKLDVIDVKGFSQPIQIYKVKDGSHA